MMKKKEIIVPLTLAQQKLVEENISFAMNIGLKFGGLARYKGIHVDDIQQEACYGLCIAAQRFSREDISFQTYAYNWCYKYIMMAINGEHFCSSSGVEDVDSIYEADDQDKPYGEQVCSRVEALLGMLNVKEREVLCLVYGIGYEQPYGFKEIAKSKSIPYKRVQQIYENALKKMRV